MNNWKDIWGNKVVDENQDVLSSLIKANGFDTGFGTYTKESWVLMILDFEARSKINKEKEVLEIGCGSGAFLYVLEKNSECKVFGVDYSSSLIHFARKAIPQGKFYVKDANEFSFGSEVFDVIFSHSVFQYFENMDYAVSVIKKAFYQLRPGGILGLLDLNDISHKSEYEKERSKLYDSMESYLDAYSGLDHLFFDKDSLVKVLSDIGFIDISIYISKDSGYLNSAYRFNIIAKKPELLDSLV